MRLVDRTDLQYSARIACLGKRFKKSPFFTWRHVCGIPAAGLAKIENAIAFLEIAGMQIVHCPHAITRYLRYLFGEKAVPRAQINCLNTAQNLRFFRLC